MLVRTSRAVLCVAVRSAMTLSSTRDRRRTSGRRRTRERRMPINGSTAEGPADGGCSRTVRICSSRRVIRNIYRLSETRLSKHRLLLQQLLPLRLFLPAPAAPAAAVAPAAASSSDSEGDDATVDGGLTPKKRKLNDGSASPAAAKPAAASDEVKVDSDDAEDGEDDDDDEDGEDEEDDDTAPAALVVGAKAAPPVPSPVAPPAPAAGLFGGIPFGMPAFGGFGFGFGGFGGFGFGAPVFAPPLRPHLPAAPAPVVNPAQRINLVVDRVRTSSISKPCASTTHMTPVRNDDCSERRRRRSSRSFKPERERAHWERKGKRE